MALASSYLPNASAATAVDARFVTLTLRDEKGAVALGIADRAVWLVTFQGATYAPAASLASTCACGDAFNRPNTVVALDPQTGGVVISFGVS